MGALRKGLALYYIFFYVVPQIKLSTQADFVATISHLNFWLVFRNSKPVSEIRKWTTVLDGMLTELQFLKKVGYSRAQELNCYSNTIGASTDSTTSK